MKNLKIYFCALCFTINIQIFCQEQKTYISEDKKLMYEYYENTEFERIYNGKFENQYYNNENTKSYLRKAKGKFIENKKTGYWYYYIGNNDGINNKTFEEYSGEYINDLKNGRWDITYQSFKEGKLQNQKININFKNDTIVGDIDFSNFTNGTIVEGTGYKGQLDSLGNFSGIWQNKINSKNENIIEFYKNFIIKILKRDAETGTIYEKYLPNRKLIINKIDEIYLKKIKLNKCEPQYYCQGTDLLRFEETNFGQELVGTYIREFFPIKHNNYKKKSEDFIYMKPKFLLIRTSEYKFERFLN